MLAEQRCSELETQLATALEKYVKDKAALEAEIEQLKLAAPVASLSPQGSSQDAVATGEVQQPGQPPTSAEDEAMDVFSQLDQSGSGSLTQAEMKKVLQKDKPLRAKLGARSWSKFFGELGCAGGLLDGTVRRAGCQRLRPRESLAASWPGLLFET